MKKFDLIFITVTLLLLGVIASLFRYEKSLRLPGFSDQTVLAISTEKNSSGQVLAYDKTNDTKIHDAVLRNYFTHLARILIHQ
jgi:hypothetical protein